MDARKSSVAMARATPSRLPERLSMDNRTAALTRHGKPILAVMPWDLFESIVEAMETDAMATSRLQQDDLGSYVTAHISIFCTGVSPIDGVHATSLRYCYLAQHTLCI